MERQQDRPPRRATAEEAGAADDPLGRLIALAARLRAPDGCPWDREQTLRDVRAYLLEEAHEAAAAIDREDWDELAGELGDLLFQVAFVARLAAEAGAFTVEEVVERIESKMIRRHPHVFGGDRLSDAGAVRRSWEERKAREKDPRRSHLAGVPDSLPSLVAALRLTQKAAGVGFDWPDRDAVVAKLREELGELEREMAGAGAEEPGEATREELGDLLFAAANLARHLGIDPESALARANAKFRRRFEAIERGLAERGVPLAEAGLEQMDELWEAAKRRR